MPPGEPRPGAPLAGLAVRLAALTYEALLLAAIGLATGFVMLPLITPLRGAVLVVPAAAGRWTLGVAVVAAWGAYAVWCWSGGRRTLPMKTWRLRLERRDGAALRKADALARFAAAWIGPLAALGAFTLLHRRGHGVHAASLLALNYAWALVDPAGQFLHDRLARTRIVRDARR